MAMTRHSGASRNPLLQIQSKLLWIPTFVGMTEEWSPEHPMQITGGKIFGGLLIETSAEYPVAAAVLILDAVIVARARGKVAAFFLHSFATSVIPPPRGEVDLRSKPGGGLLAEDSITPPGSVFSRATLPIKGRDGACCAVTASQT